MAIKKLPTLIFGFFLIPLSAIVEIVDLALRAALRKIHGICYYKRTTI